MTRTNRYESRRQPRSWLYVPGDRDRAMRKATRRGADAVILDLEDGVAPTARTTRGDSCAKCCPPLAGGDAAVWVRVDATSIATDVEAVAQPALDGVALAKADVDGLDRLDRALTTAEIADGRLDPFPVLAVIETARGLASVDAIARAHLDLACGHRVAGERDNAPSQGVPHAVPPGISGPWCTVVSVGQHLDPVPDVIGGLVLGEVGVIGCDVCLDQRDHGVVGRSPSDESALAPHLSGHLRSLLRRYPPDVDPGRQMSNEHADTDRSTRVQLCGPFVVEIDGRRTDQALPGRQARVLFGYLTLSRLQPVGREIVIGALWGDAPPPEAAAALSVLVSKIRAATGLDLVAERGALRLVLPESTQVDVEVAVASLHAAESGLVGGQWQRTWMAALTARFIARRPFLREADAPWADVWRRRLADVHVRALECYAAACLELGGAEVSGAERAAVELTETDPLRETGHLLLMRTLAARGNVAEALRVYERLRVHLSDELGVNPSRQVQELYVELLG